MWWSVLRWHHRCLEMQIAIVISSCRWFSAALCTHSLILIQALCLIKKNLTSYQQPPGRTQLLPFPTFNFFYTNTHLELIQHIQTTAVWLFIQQRGRFELAGQSGCEGSVSGWWLRSPAAFSAKSWEFKLNQGKDRSPLCVTQRTSWSWGQNGNRMTETEVTEWLTSLLASPLFLRGIQSFLSRSDDFFFRTIGRNSAVQAQRGH